MFITLKKLVKLTKLDFVRLEVRDIIKTVTGQRVTALTEETLTGRFIIYLDKFNVHHGLKSENKHELINTFRRHPVNIEKFDLRNIATMLTALNDRKYIQNKKDFNKLYNAIDTECCNRLKESDANTKLSLLHSYMVGIPNIIVQSDYYNKAVEDLMNTINNLNKEQLIQLIFFIGLLKNSNKANIWLRQCLKLFNDSYINNLSTVDLCIICNSTFKTSTKIKNNHLLYKIKSHLNENLSILKDPALFITFIKTLRHNRYQDEDIMNTISCTMMFNKTMDCYSFSAICHILALYADYLYYDKTVIEELTNRGLDKLKNSQFTSKDAYLTDQFRVKDLRRFLWALSNINFVLDKNDIENIIIPHIERRISAGEFENDPGMLVDLILYLWMMQYRPYELIKQTLTPKNVEFIRANNVASKKSVNLLLTCLYYEDSELYKSLNVTPTNEHYNIKIQVNKRPQLQIVVNQLRYRDPGAVIKCDLKCQVPCLNIVGIIYQKDVLKNVNVEVLDSYTCLKNTKEEKIPSGLMQLKLRLLKTLERDVLVLEKDDISSISEI